MQGRLENELKKEQAILTKLQTMPDYVSEWYYNLKASQRTATTLRDYVNKIHNFLFFINSNVSEVKIKDINLSNVQRFFISIQTKEVNGQTVYTSDSYQQTVWCCLNSFLEFLKETGRIDKNYIKMISKPKNKDLEKINEHRMLLTKSDFNKILQSVKYGAGSGKAKSFQDRMKSRDMAIMLLFMTTGMRKTALSEINVEDVRFDVDVLYVTDKGDKHHTYVLSEKTLSALSDWMYDRQVWDNGTSDALFITEKGERISPSAIYKLVDKYCSDALGYHVSPHKLRAGFCSILYGETGNAEFVRRAVGHSNISTTQRYIVTNNKEKEEASGLIDHILI